MAVKKRLGEMLLEAGVIDETQLHAALGHQRKWGGKLGQALLDLKLATEPQIVAALSRKFGYEVVDVAALQLTPQLAAVLKLVPRELALRQTLVPIAADASSITVVMADPSNIAVVDELSFRTGKRIRIALAGDREIAAAVRRLCFADQKVAAIPIDEPSGETPMETTRDPFAAMPDHIREGYFNRPAHTLTAATPAAPVPAAPAARADVPAPPPLPRPTAAPRVDVQPTFTPPPTLARPQAAPAFQPAWPAPPPPPTYPPGSAPRAPAAAPPADPLGEPILATELAPAEDGPFEGPQPDRQLTPRMSALLDALERVKQGEESGLVRPSQLGAALLRLLLRKGLVTEAEVVAELAKKPGDRGA